MKILVGYRGSNIGQDLIKLAVLHARAFAGEVSIVTSLWGGEKSSSEQIEEAQERLAAVEKILTGQGIKNETHLLIRGKTPGEDIVSFAQEINCDEILIGVKSRSKVGKILFGSTAQFIILKAPCPVVSIK
jgi:nucleotide-binding universal stress UspA family protein